MPRDRWTLNASMKAEYAKLNKAHDRRRSRLGPARAQADWIRIYVDPTLGAVRVGLTQRFFRSAVRILGVAPKTVIQGFRLTSPGWDLDAYVLEDPAGREFSPRLLPHARSLRLPSDWKPSIIDSDRRGSSGAATQSKARCSPSV